MKSHRVLAAALGLVLSLFSCAFVTADERAVIDANTERALSWLRDSGRDTAKLLDTAAGVLVFPDLVKMGFGVGGEFGEGALLIDGKTVDYYATAGSFFGMAADTKFKAEIIFFMTEDALSVFRKARSWKVGDHAQIPVAASGKAALKSPGPYVGLIFSDEGLVSHLQLHGDRITRIVR